MPETKHSVEIVEDYKSFTPQFDVVKVVKGLTSYVPPKYLAGLAKVVLTNVADLSRERKREKFRSRGKSTMVVECRGIYYQVARGQPAWIEVFVDNVLSSDTNFPVMLKIPFYRDFVFAEVLYHEIGHHIHATHKPEYKEKENLAEIWKKRLLGRYLRRKYWYLQPLVFLFKPLIEMTIKFLKRKV